MFSCELLKNAQNNSKYCSDNNDIKTPIFLYNGNLISEHVEMMKIKTITGEAYTDHLYESIIDYDFSNPESNTFNGRSFSQLVWKSIEEIGIGFTCKNGSCYIVTDYFPPTPMPGTNLYESQVQELQY